MTGVDAAADPLLGTSLAGRYELLERIGDGGMGRVYRARTPDGTMVAVKILDDALTRDGSWVKRFENEVAAIRQLTHPSTVRLLDHGTSAQGRLFLVMELLSGRPLREVMEREGPLPPDRVLRILAECCPPLQEAHEKGIFHRDLKPDNLFVSPGDKIKVLDFSVAKLRAPENGLQTAAGVIFGTPQYMSPEQGRGFPVDARSDLYSLGMIAFEMLTGAVPFTARDPMEVLAMQVRRPLPALPGVPEPVVALLQRLCAKAPRDRFRSTDELAVACRDALRLLVRPAPSVAPAPAAAAVAAVERTAPVPLPHASGAAGPSAATWILSLVLGVGAGLLAYWLYTLVAG